MIEDMIVTNKAIQNDLPFDIINWYMINQVCLYGAIFWKLPVKLNL